MILNPCDEDGCPLSKENCSAHNGGLWNTTKQYFSAATEFLESGYDLVSNRLSASASNVLYASATVYLASKAARSTGWRRIAMGVPSRALEAAASAGLTAALLGLRGALKVGGRCSRSTSSRRGQRSLANTSTTSSPPASSTLGRKGKHLTGFHTPTSGWPSLRAWARAGSHTSATSTGTSSRKGGLTGRSSVPA